MLVANPADLGMFDYYYKTDTARGSRFAMGMAGTEAVKCLTEDIYPFHELPAGSKIVDVGGGRGQVSVRIAEKEPHLSFVVQDHATVIEAGQAEGISEAAGKAVKWQAHNFFEAQPVKGADVYLFRFILHDHPDT
jgi:sterigmatocystin 8-O-methyltransferase